MNKIKSSINGINNPSWFISQFHIATSSNSFFANELSLTKINIRHKTLHGEASNKRNATASRKMHKDPTIWSGYCFLRKVNMSSSHFLSVSVTKSTCVEATVESIYQLRIHLKQNRTSRLLAFCSFYPITSIFGQYTVYCTDTQEVS